MNNIKQTKDMNLNKKKEKEGTDNVVEIKKKFVILEEAALAEITKFMLHECHPKQKTAGEVIIMCETLARSLQTEEEIKEKFYSKGKDGE